MTIKPMPGGGTVIAWKPGDPIDWTTPNSQWHGHEFCGNCSWDAPGCGCPRDCPKCQELRAYCGHGESSANPGPDDDEADEEWDGDDE